MKYIYTLLIFIGLSGAAYADDIKGKWLCEVINAGDGSGSQYVYTISGKNLNIKEIGWSYSTDLVQRFAGKTNPFKVFVEVDNTLSETVIVLRSIIRKNYQPQLHMSKTTTSDGWRVKARVWYGICNKRY